MLGGLDLGQVAEDVARRHIGYVAQDARLVNGTLRDNLAMGLGDVGDEDIMEVARSTRLDTVIAARSEGLALQIQEGGRGLSGGQRSLVGINRLLLARPDIWLLDEPTSSLDQATETAALQAIDDALADDNIMVIVTHKLQLLPRFTRVIAMANGKIVRDGPTQDVLRELLPPRSGGARSSPEGTVTTSRAGGKIS